MSASQPGREHITQHVLAWLNENSNLINCVERDFLTKFTNMRNSLPLMSETLLVNNFTAVCSAANAAAAGRTNKHSTVSSRDRDDDIVSGRTCLVVQVYENLFESNVSTWLKELNL